MVWYKQCDLRDASCRENSSGIELEHCGSSIDGDLRRIKEE